VFVLYKYGQVLINWIHPQADTALRDARWFIFKPKIPFGYIIEGLILENVDTFYGYLGKF
jgi:hypothetical protein